MSETAGSDSILQQFNIPTKEEWLNRIEADLRGKAMETTLWKFSEGTVLSPFAHQDDITGSSEIRFDPKWEIAEVFLLSDPVSTNAEVLESLQGGCETVIIEVDGPTDWELLFKGIALEMIKAYVIPKQEEQSELIMQSLDAWLRDSDTVGSVYVRPEGGLVLGASGSGDRDLSDDLANTVKAGLRMIEDGYDDDVVECIAQVGSSYFIEIARLRALRILWHNALEALEIHKPELFIEARFAEQDMDEDQYINMISASTKALSAICGGVDRLVVAPSRNPSDGFTRRISRNVHHLLKYETRLDEIKDPVAGSYYIESLTQRLAVEAWNKIIEK